MSRDWPVHIDKGSDQRWTLLLGPVLVHSTHQGEGLGIMRILQVIESALEAGWSRVLLVGDLSYYGPFGFQKLDGVVMRSPTNPDQVMGLTLREGAWQGVEGTVIRAIPKA